MSKIVVVGSINMDVVSLIARHPRPGETIFGSNVKFIPGGKGSNQAVAASRLTDGVMLVGKLGKDAFGTALHQFLQSENLNLEHLSFSDTAPSGTAIIAVDENSENTIIVVSGSNFEISVEDVTPISIGAGDIVVAPFEVPQEALKAIFSRAKQAGASTVLNPAPAGPFIDGLHELCDYLIVNETELAYFAGVETVSKEFDVIHEQAKKVQKNEKQTIIVTLGSKGAVCLHGNNVYKIEGHKVNAVDTTGAGDCFTGALSVALVEGRTLHDAIKFANVAASLSVQKLGASDSLPHREQVETTLNS